MILEVLLSLLPELFDCFFLAYLLRPAGLSQTQGRYNATEGRQAGK